MAGMMDMMPMGDMGEKETPSAPAASDAPMDDESAAIAEAFPDIAGDPARIDAFKTAIQLCLERLTGQSYEDEKEPAADIALVLGPPPKKSEKKG